MKATPIMKKVGKTVPAVRIGCQAGNRCCLKALSVDRWNHKVSAFLYKIWKNLNWNNESKLSLDGFRDTDDGNEFPEWSGIAFKI